MSTLISQLPEEIRFLALQRQRECKDKDFSKRTDELFHAFDWHETEEGYKYWTSIYNQEYDVNTVRQQLESIIDRRLSRNETIDLLVKLWEDGK